MRKIIQKINNNNMTTLTVIGIIVGYFIGRIHEFLRNDKTF